MGGHLALDFANTVDDPEGPERYDHAGTYPELVGWSARIGILPPDQAEALLTAADEHPRARSAALKRAHLLRDILIETFTEIAAINSGRVSSHRTLDACCALGRLAAVRDGRHGSRRTGVGTARRIS